MRLAGLVALFALGDDPLDPSQYRFPSGARTIDLPAETGDRPYLGVMSGEQGEGGGAAIGEVSPDGPAGQAGIRAGDRVLRFGGEEVRDFNDLSAKISARRAGEMIEVVVDREGEALTFSVRLGGKPRGSATGLPVWRKGEFKLGVVLFEFSDVRHNPEFRRADFEAMLFSRGAYTGRNASGERVYGSLADYYAENSGGRLAVTGRVFDWVALDDPREYFEEKPMGQREAWRRLLPRAVERVRKRDGDGCFDDLDGIVFLYAGRQSYLRPKMLWPHRANLRVGDRSLPYYLTAEGGRHFNAINVHVHEFGHMLGLPDQYGRNHATGIGKWCTMAVGHMGGGESGPHRPFHLCVWCKEQLGWVKAAAIRPGEAQRLKLDAVEKDTSMVFRIVVSPEESYYLENRQRVGFDSDLEGTGLLVWRVRRGGSVDLVEAHGKAVPNASLVEPDEIPWPSHYNSDFTPATTPPAPAGLFLTDIVEQEGIAYFKIGFEKAARSRGLERRRDY